MKLTDIMTFRKPMGKYFPSWQARMGHVNASGASQEEAAKSLATKIQAVFAGEWSPIMIQHGGYLVLVWREPEAGWMYAARSKESGTARFDSSITITEGTRDEVERRARMHLAGYIVACAPKEAINTVNLEAIAECILHAEDRAKWLDDERFARRARLIMEQYQITWQEAMRLAREWQVEA